MNSSSFISRSILIQLLLPLSTAVAFSAAWMKRRCGMVSPLSVHSKLPMTSSMDATHILPRFYPGDVSDGTHYPSPLHSIHIKTLFAQEEISTILQIAKKHAEETGCWEKPDFERHSTYATCDFPVEQCYELVDYLEEINFQHHLWEQIEVLYGIPSEELSFLDFFCAHYQARDEKMNGATSYVMDSLEPHRDGSLISFTMTLSDPDSFEGGGTYFEALRDDETLAHCDYGSTGGIIRPSRSGDVVFHSGKALHGAAKVTAGSRTVLVGFVHVEDWCQRPGAIAEACRDWGRLDVAKKYFERQKQALNLNDRKFPTKKINRWVSGSSHINGVYGPLSSVTRRADCHYQRQQRLETEDVLLRRILLSEDEREKMAAFDVFEGDISRCCKSYSFVQSVSNQDNKRVTDIRDSKPKNL